MGHPKIGMHYKDVRKKLKTLGKFPRLKESLLNQARLHEGEGAVTELRYEIDGNNHSSNRVGYSVKYESAWERIFNKGSGQS